MVKTKKMMKKTSNYSYHSSFLIPKELWEKHFKKNKTTPPPFLEKTLKKDEKDVILPQLQELEGNDNQKRNILKILERVRNEVWFDETGKLKLQGETRAGTDIVEIVKFLTSDADTLKNYREIDKPFPSGSPLVFNSLLSSVSGEIDYLKQQTGITQAAIDVLNRHKTNILKEAKAKEKNKTILKLKREKDRRLGIKRENYARKNEEEEEKIKKREDLRHRRRGFYFPPTEESSEGAESDRSEETISERLEESISEEEKEESGSEEEKDESEEEAGESEKEEEISDFKIDTNTDETEDITKEATEESFKNSLKENEDLKSNSEDTSLDPSLNETFVSLPKTSLKTFSPYTEDDRSRFSDESYLSLTPSPIPKPNPTESESEKDKLNYAGLATPSPPKLEGHFTKRKKETAKSTTPKRTPNPPSRKRRPTVISQIKRTSTPKGKSTKNKTSEKSTKNKTSETSTKNKAPVDYILPELRKRKEQVIYYGKGLDIDYEPDLKKLFLKWHSQKKS